MSENKYSINCVSRGVNNFFEFMTNSSNPKYIQPVSENFNIPNNNFEKFQPNKYPEPLKQFEPISSNLETPFIPIAK